MTPRLLLAILLSTVALTPPAAAASVCHAAPGGEVCADVAVAGTSSYASASYAAADSRAVAGNTSACGRVGVGLFDIVTTDCGTRHSDDATGSTNTCPGADDEVFWSILGIFDRRHVCLRHESATLGTHEACVATLVVATVLGGGGAVDGCTRSAVPRRDGVEFCHGALAVASVYTAVEARECGRSIARLQADPFAGVHYCGPGLCRRVFP